MAKYNHAFEISATIDTDKEADQLTWKECRVVLLERIRQLDCEEYPEEAIFVWDTYENKKERLNNEHR